MPLFNRVAKQFRPLATYTASSFFSIAYKVRGYRLHHAWGLLIFDSFMPHITVVQLLIALAALAFAFVACFCSLLLYMLQMPR